MSHLVITVAARESPLSKAQVLEVLNEMRQKFPSIEFTPTYLPSLGDKDKKTSLRLLNKTNFFTKEIDDLVLNGSCQIGIHSAKDLPEPIAKGLSIIAITKGVDSSDVLVLKPGKTIQTLASSSVIATSSAKREENVSQLRNDLRFIDVRGTIQERLALIETGKVDGVVIAEAALIRLGLINLNRIKLPGDTTPLQGKLAILARDQDKEMLELFSSIDERATV